MLLEKKMWQFSLALLSMTLFVPNDICVDLNSRFSQDYA
jgi:hypothetical protein